MHPFSKAIMVFSRKAFLCSNFLILPGVVAGARLLHFNNLRPQVPENHCSKGSSQYATQVQNPDQILERGENSLK